MAEPNNKKEQAFVREQIKEKPVNRKKLLGKVGTAALCGLIFALTAGIVLWIFSMIMSSRKPQTPEELPTEEESETEIAVETESEAPEEAAIEMVSMTLDDYQQLQDELYRIGTDANKSIVAITSVVSETDWFNNVYEMETSGTGVIISRDAAELLILTEASSIKNKDKISVTFVDETSASATLKGCDRNSGIALISVDVSALDSKTRQNIACAEMANSNNVKNGQLVIALGSPLGTAYSILTGNITSTNNEITRLDNNFDVFTTDIIGDSDSSGILINTDGEVIGLIMQDYNTSQSNSTLTAVSISETQKLIELMTAGTRIPYMGMYLTTVTDKISQTNNLPLGVYVREAQLDSPAMLSGIQSGDVITEINGMAVYSVEGFYSQLLRTQVGEACEIVVQRQNGDSYSQVKFQIEPAELQQ